MKFDITSVKTLLKDGQLEVQEGTFLVCENKSLKFSTYMKEEDLLIEFEAPFLYLHVTKLGPKKLLNIIRPRVEYIKITKNSTIIKLSTLGEWEIES